MLPDNRSKVRDITMVKFMRLGWLMALLLLVSGVALGFAGGLHPAWDSLSILRMPMALLCLLTLPVGGPWVLRAALLLAGGAGMVTTLPLWLLSQPSDDLTLYSKNLWFANAQLPALAADIRDSGAEVVTLQEVSERTDEILKLLAVDFPYQHLCRFSGWSGVAVLSKHPISTTRCSDRRAVAAAQISRDGQEVWIAAVHLPWPFPYGNAGAADQGVALLDDLTGPVVMAGDFNIFPWADSVRRLNHASGTRAAGPIRPTYMLRGVPLLLDHVHAPGGGVVTTRPLLGSDHRGVLARVSLTR